MSEESNPPLTCYLGRGHPFSPDEYGVPHNGLDVAESQNS